MNNINWFKYRQYLGYAIDLGRIFPLLSKQKGWAKFFSGIFLQLIESINSVWMQIQEIAHQINFLLVGLLPNWIYEASLNRLLSIRVEAVIPFVLQ